MRHLLFLHCRNDNQDFPGIGFSNLNRALFAIPQMRVQIDWTVPNDLFGLFRRNLMNRQMADILLRPKQKVNYP